MIKAGGSRACWGCATCLNDRRRPVRLIVQVAARIDVPRARVPRALLPDHFRVHHHPKVLVRQI
eukprot:2088342-Pleurochrysis_carterae.AAC.1